MTGDGTRFAYDVFLSYDSQDKAQVTRLAERLRVAGLRVWFDDWVIQPGANIFLTIEQGLQSARTLVLCLSRAALCSSWVELERTTALFRDPTNLDRRFVPLLLHTCELPDTLRQFKYIDYRDESQRSFEALLQACSGDNYPTALAGRSTANPEHAEAKTPSSHEPNSGRPAYPYNSERGRRRVPPGIPSSVAVFAWLAFGAFLCGVALLLILLLKAEWLVRLGLDGRLFYLVLLPLGVSVAAFLFGVLRSYARYNGQIFGGTIELGGPLVGFALVVVGGFVLVPNPSSFAVTVYVHGKGGLQDLMLRNSGAVLMDLGSDRRREVIGDRGEARFTGIPPSLRGHAVPVSIDASGYEVSRVGETYVLGDASIYLAVQPAVVKLEVLVKSKTGPVADAEVSLGTLSARTNRGGYASLEVRGRPGQQVTLEVSAKGYPVQREIAVLGSNELVVTLEPAP